MLAEAGRHIHRFVRSRSVTYGRVLDLFHSSHRTATLRRTRPFALLAALTLGVAVPDVGPTPLAAPRPEGEWTAVTDTVMDPQDPDLSAATWDRHRTVAAGASASG